MRSRTWVAVATEERLDAVIFGLGDQRFVFALIPASATSRVFKLAIVERHGKDFVDGAPAQKPPAFLSHGSSAKACTVQKFICSDNKWQNTS